MLNVSARREATYLDPLGMLKDCHRRVQRFLGDQLRLARARLGGPLTDQERQVLETSRRYFAEAAPRHTADEEASLFPMLRRLPPSPERDAVLRQAAELEADHSVAERLHAEVDALTGRWLQEGELPMEVAMRLTAALGTLQGLYDRHIAREDDELLPACARLLGPQEVEALGRELAARRGVDFDRWRGLAAQLGESGDR